MYELYMLTNIYCKGPQKKHIHHQNPYGGFEDVTITRGTPGPENLTTVAADV